MTRLCLTPFPRRQYGARARQTCKPGEPFGRRRQSVTGPGQSGDLTRGCARRADRAGAPDLEACNRADRRAHAEPGGADPATRRAYRRGRRQAAAAAAHPRRGAALRLSRASATWRSRPASSSSTPRPCCTTTWWTKARSAAARPAPTRCSATRPRVLVGDFLFARAFQLMVEDGSLKVLAHPVRRRRHHRRGRGAAAGHPERHRHDRGAVPRGDRGQDRRAVRRGAAGRRRGRRPAGRRRRRRCDDYGRNLGIAFQLVDDALDYCGGAGTAGQDGRRRFPRGQDHPAGAAGLRRGDEAERGFWRRTIEAPSRATPTWTAPCT